LLLIIILGFNHSAKAQYWNLTGNSSVDSNNFVGSTNYADLFFYTNNLKRMTLQRNGNLVISPNSTYLGATTTLTLYDKGSDVLLTIKNNPSLASPGYLLIGLGTDGPDAVINQVANANLSFFTNNTERITITNGGNIGIGTTTPTSKLHINGTFRLEDGTQAQNKVLLSEANGLASWQYLTLTLNSSNILSVTGGSNIDLSPYLDNTDNQTISINDHELSISNGNSIIIPDNVNDADSDPNNEKINSITLNGNTLEIAEAGDTISVDLSSLDNSNMNINDADSSPVNELQDLQVNGTKLSLSQSTAEVDLLQLGINYWSKTNTNELYYATGNVGIGLQQANRQLQIHSETDESAAQGGGVGLGLFAAENTPQEIEKYRSSILLTNKKTGKTANDGLILESENLNARIQLRETGTLSLLTKEHKGIEIKTNGDIRIPSLSGTGERILVADMQGNISTIETNSLADNLGNHTATQNLNMSNKKIYNIDAINIIREHGDWITLNTSNGKNWSLHNHYNEGTLRFSYHENNNNDWNILVLNGDTGNVGIGTSNPAKKLEVKGDVRFLSSAGTTSAFDILSNNTPTRRGISLPSDPNGEFNFFVHAWQQNADFNFNKLTGSNSEYVTLMTIKETGNVGIGTTNPQEKLSVNGVLLAKEVKIRTSSTYWPDYVFNKNYKITDLIELEKFIKQNKHLPNIPTAKQVEKDGIAVGEMNKLLLQKIEELTLYIIEQEKRIKALENKK